MRMEEYVRVEEISEIKQKINALNDLLLKAIGDIRILKELQKEKKEAIKNAKEIAKELVPELQDLIHFLKGDVSSHKISHKEKGRRGRRKKVKETSSNTLQELEELKKNLEEIRRSLGRLSR